MLEFQIFCLSVCFVSVAVGLKVVKLGFYSYQTRDSLRSSRWDSFVNIEGERSTGS
jgi:hypothetical protein